MNTYIQNACVNVRTYIRMYLHNVHGCVCILVCLFVSLFVCIYRKHVVIYTCTCTYMYNVYARVCTHFLCCLQ